MNDSGDIDLIEGSGGSIEESIHYVAGVLSDETSETGYVLEYLEGESFETIFNYTVPLIEVEGLTCYYYQETPNEEEKYGIMFAGFGSGPTASYVTIWEDDTVTVDVYSLSGGGSGDTVTTTALSGNFTYTNWLSGIQLSNTTTYPCLEEAMNAFNNGASTVKIPLGELNSLTGLAVPFAITGVPLTYYSSSETSLTCSSYGGTVVFDAPMVEIPGEDSNTAYVEATVNMFTGNAEVPIIPTTWKLSFYAGAPKLNIYAAFGVIED